MAAEKKLNASTPYRLSDVQQWDIETDIAIVGFGGAGACAAIEAADAGAEVIIFEVASDSGGSTKLSSAEIYMGGNGGTPIQKACGFEDSTEDMIRFLEMTQGELGDKEKIRTYCENSVDHYHWLVDKGARYKESFHEERAIMALTDDCLLYTGNEKAWPFVEHAKPCPRGHNLYIEGDNGGPFLMNALTAQVEKRSNKIRVEYEARVVTLIADAHNEVHGCIVRMNMKEYTVKARKGVILCAGGFVMNDEMLEKYAPKLLKATYKIGNPADTGTGIKMGISVGANIINMSEGFVSMPFYPPADITKGIIVNQQAQRFINEDCYHSRVGAFALNQIGKRIYFILHAGENFRPPMFLGAGFAGTGETIEELAEEIHLDAKMLRHTIEYYNEHANKAQDPLFHKDAFYLEEIKAPYVALDLTPGNGALLPYFTLGGLETLVTGEVITAGGEVIKGLYAAGRTTAGVPRRAEGYASGLSVGDATFFGRLAGKHLAHAASR